MDPLVIHPSVIVIKGQSFKGWNQRGIEKQCIERKRELGRKMNSNLGEKDSVLDNLFDAPLLLR